MVDKDKTCIRDTKNTWNPSYVFYYLKHLYLNITTKDEK